MYVFRQWRFIPQLVLTKTDDTLPELLLQERRTACSPRLVLDLICRHEYRLCVSCIWDSSSARTQRST